MEPTNATTQRQWRCALLRQIRDEHDWLTPTDITHAVPVSIHTAKAWLKPEGNASQRTPNLLALRALSEYVDIDWILDDPKIAREYHALPKS